MRPLLDGEYDLANISLIGFDPVTGRSFDECIIEWEQEFAAVIEQAKNLRWWQLRRRWQIAKALMALHQRQGMH